MKKKHEDEDVVRPTCLSQLLAIGFWFYLTLLRTFKFDIQGLTLREKSPYSELSWSAFSRIRTECGEILSISYYSVRMRENADQNNSEYGHILRSVKQRITFTNFSQETIALYKCRISKYLSAVSVGNNFSTLFIYLFQFILR